MERKTTMIVTAILIIGIVSIGTWWVISKYDIKITQNQQIENQKEQGQNTPPSQQPGQGQLPGSNQSAPTGDRIGGTVTAVNGSTISAENRQGKMTIITNSNTKFTSNGQASSLTNVTAGKFVEVIGQKQADGSWLVTQVSISDRPPAPPGQPPGQGQSLPPGQQPQSSSVNNKYSIEQAISDNAQLHTLAFGGLGFLTGNLCSDSFLPPGKVADFFGFQYLRDTTQAGKGHSTDFVTNAANNVLYTLNDSQKAKMIALAKTQASLVNEFAYKRYPLMVAFRRQLEGDIPEGKSGLSKEAVMEYSASQYEIDARISMERANLFAEIINSLTDEQKTYLDKMVEGGFASWPALGDQIDKQSLSHDEHVLVMTYASEMFGWYAGDVEADTYFCPERQGDYFGGFYIKDAPAIGNAGYTIDESITGNSGEAFIAALDDTQKPVIIALVDTQRPAISGIVEIRRAMATELRKALTSSIDENKVLSLAREYGRLDGEISYYYATAFSKVGKTLTNEQMNRLMDIRNLDKYSCGVGKIYLYSVLINQPEIPNTDFLFE